MGRDALAHLLRDSWAPLPRPFSSL